jgi:hypothetical protein
MFVHLLTAAVNCTVKYAQKLIKSDRRKENDAKYNYAGEREHLHMYICALKY